MGYVQIGSKAVGSIVKIKENGTPVNYIIVHQGLPGSMYDASCDGTWVWREDIAKTHAWDTRTTNQLEVSEIHAYLNSEWLNRYDDNIKSAIKRVKIPYRQNGGMYGFDCSGVNGLSCKIILLGACEVGFERSEHFPIPMDGTKLSYFASGSNSAANAKRMAKLNGSAVRWWLRSPLTYNQTTVCHVLDSGGPGGSSSNSTYGIVPAFILPPTLLVGDDGTVTANTPPSVPGSVTIPGSISGGTNITVKWAASTDPQGNLAGYKVERSTNGGSAWAQIYQGPATQTTDNVAFGTPSVVYRVLAYDTEGLASGWRTSNQVTVTNNTAPHAPGSINVPLNLIGGAAVTVSWAAASDSEGNLSGYQLERQVAGGGWTQVYKGNALSHRDTITKGWASVAYRVRAYDSYNAYSPYVTSPTRTVDNNTAPTITCANANNSDLGTKSAGFSLAYSVGDADQDAVTVSERMDGKLKRSYTATLGQQNSFAVTGTYFQQLLNGKHTMEITAADKGGKSAVHTLTFAKSVTSLSVTMVTPMSADAKISILALSVSGSIPADAKYQVLVTNNGKDPSPVWEDATEAVRRGVNYLFSNQEASNGFAFNFKVTASRGPSGLGGYITSIQGGFE